MPLPDSVLVKFTDVRVFLGVSKTTLRKLESSGVLQKVTLPGCKYGKYRRSQVLALVESFEKEGGAA